MLHCGGPSLRALMSSLDTAPREGNDAFPAASRAMEWFFRPTDTTRFDRHVLAASSQRVGESTDTFVARLKRQAQLRVVVP
jgi:hypothetical protein